MPVSIHHQYYLGEGPATRYYRGLQRWADFIMVPGERENRRMECGMVGWLVGRLPAWVGWQAGLEVECGESIAGACRLSRVLRISKKPHAGETRCLRVRHNTHTHTQTCARAHNALTRELYAFQSVFYERSIFWETFWGICGWSSPVCFPVAPMAEFSLQWLGYCSSNASFFRWNAHACTRNVGYALVRECPA